MTLWFTLLRDQPGILEMLANYVPPVIEGERTPFLTKERVWSYLYLIGSAVIFAIIWYFNDRDKWYIWSVVGSTIIIVSTYFQVQISLYLNDWYGGFFDLIQQALGDANSVELSEYYGYIFTVAGVLIFYIAFLVILDFFVSHYVFRWRTAMNDYYMDSWARLRHIEGAAQRVQEDTMRFARIVEGLGVSFVRSMMTLIAFLPLLYSLSQNIQTVPILGAIDGSLVYLAVLSALLGTVILAAVGFRLPGLEFNNQKVEAAYRKELVYGEDHEQRAEPQTIQELFADVRKNYFRLYFHYFYFNVMRWTYIQASNFIPFIALGPSVIAAHITFGLFQQILNAFDRVEESFKFFANSWTTIIELLSIHKRLMAFERVIHDQTSPLSGDGLRQPAE